MSKRPFSWRDNDNHPAPVPCQRCQEPKDRTDLDRLGWCEDCRNQAKAKAARLGWIGGTAIAALVSGYIWLTVQPTDLIPRLWLVIPIAVLWLGARLVREIAYGVIRYRQGGA